MADSEVTPPEPPTFDVETEFPPQTRSSPFSDVLGLAVQVVDLLMESQERTKEPLETLVECGGNGTRRDATRRINIASGDQTGLHHLALAPSRNNGPVHSPPSFPHHDHMHEPSRMQTITLQHKHFVDCNEGCLNRAGDDSESLAVRRYACPQGTSPS